VGDGAVGDPTTKTIEELTALLSNGDVIVTAATPTSATPWPPYSSQRGEFGFADADVGRCVGIEEWLLPHGGGDPTR